jgi:hypothetical protein
VCFRAYEKKVTNNSSLLAEYCGEDPLSFAAKRILSFPALVDKDFMVSRSCPQHLSAGVLSGNELESELNMVPLPGEDNYLDLEMRLDSGVNDLDYGWTA